MKRSIYYGKNARTSFHEAGHAVMALFERQTFEFVELRSTDQSNGTEGRRRSSRS